MRQNYFTSGPVLINREYNSDEIKSNLDKFENKLENGNLTTTFDGRVVCTVDVSKVYYNFDFTNFTKSILNEISNYFTPENYRLSVKSGVQEIRLIGDEIFIDNEKYKKIISIINSTDKSKALSMNVGLVKMSGKYIKSITILTSFSNKHYKTSLPDKIKAFSDNLKNFNINIDFHIKTIEDLKNKNISMLEFTKSFLFDHDGNLISSNKLKLNALIKKLIYSYNFKNMYSKLSKFNNIKTINDNNFEDINLNSKMVYDAYMELFSDKDTGIIARESRRIIDTLDKVDVVEV